MPTTAISSRSSASTRRRKSIRPGRFSGGTNYIDTLSLLLDAPVENFAIGGALTDNTNTNGAGIPGFITEWNAYLAGGGGLFPTVSGTFDEGDLVTFSIGGNDARFYQQNGGTLAGAPTAATISAATAAVGIERARWSRRPEHQLPRRQHGDPAGDRQRPHRAGDPQLLFDDLQCGDAESWRTMLPTE